METGLFSLRYTVSVFSTPVKPAALVSFFAQCAGSPLFPKNVLHWIGYDESGTFCHLLNQNRATADAFITGPHT
jgi:hypothetical protein